MNRFVPLLSLLLVAPSASQDIDLLILDESLQMPVDENLPAPVLVGFEPYISSDGWHEGDPMLMITFESVAGASSYRIWREVENHYVRDPSGDLIRLAEPESVLVPWASVDAFGHGDIMRVGLFGAAELGGRWGISTEAVRDGQRFRSRVVQFSLHEPQPTAVEAMGWAALKSATK